MSSTMLMITSQAVNNKISYICKNITHKVTNIKGNNLERYVLVGLNLTT